jgi:murein L,D-transpeptidase YafK
MKRIKYFFIATLLLLVSTSFRQPITKDDYYIVVNKGQYLLSIFDRNNSFVVSYPAVFGNNDMGDKMYEGDRRTPEGTFYIVAKRPHSKWEKFLALDYPNAESYRRFNERKARGLIPAHAKIGGSIGIHGTWPNEENAVDEHQNWTLGCVSTKNDYIKEIYDQLPVGTRVEIVP